MLWICDLEDCPRKNQSSWKSIAVRNHKFRFMNKIFCSKECFKRGFHEQLKNEIIKVSNKKPDLKHARLGSILLAEGVITKEQLEVALKLQEWSINKQLGQCFVELDFITNEQLAYYLSQQARVPFLSGEEIEKQENTFLSMPLYAVHLTKTVPYTYNFYTNELSVGCIAPMSPEIFSVVGRVLEINAVPFIVQETFFERLFEKYQEVKGNDDSRIESQSFILNHQMDILKLSDYIYSKLTLEDGCVVQMGVVKNNIWIKLRRKNDTIHYFFPFSILF